ncbi:hypothetical protein ACFFV7_35825 [Nonomuraea spiralis]|uniref:Uncharacterized protein n=1 Tax=Nonomuraea spiralis TaxID=46182 RepID=A0ABV5IPY1_9ACTN|nr:hypothetical protein [Nonomuraea spiralis]
MARLGVALFELGVCRILVLDRFAQEDDGAHERHLVVPGAGSDEVVRVLGEGEGGCVSAGGVAYLVDDEGPGGEHGVQVVERVEVVVADGHLGGVGVGCGSCADDHAVEQVVASGGGFPDLGWDVELLAAGRVLCYGRQVAYGLVHAVLGADGEE